jgi:hypothetical protein
MVFELFPGAIGVWFFVWGFWVWGICVCSSWVFPGKRVLQCGATLQGLKPFSKEGVYAGAEAPPPEEPERRKSRSFVRCGGRGMTTRALRLTARNDSVEYLSEEWARSRGDLGWAGAGAPARKAKGRVADATRPGNIITKDRETAAISICGRKSKWVTISDVK